MMDEWDNGCSVRWEDGQLVREVIEEQKRGENRNLSKVRSGDG